MAMGELFTRKRKISQRYLLLYLKQSTLVMKSVQLFVRMTVQSTIRADGAIKEDADSAEKLLDLEELIASAERRGNRKEVNKLERQLDNLLEAQLDDDLLDFG